MIRLKTFAPIPDDISVAASIEVHDFELFLKFHLRDPKKLVTNSLMSANFNGDEYVRSDGLWKTTCFEAFWSEVGTSRYWELNLSATRAQWNLYTFESYRTPQPPTAANDFKILSCEISTDELRCVLRSSHQLKELEGSLCTVIQTQNGIHYFSSNHAGVKPDFHLRAGFLPLRDLTSRA